MAAMNAPTIAGHTADVGDRRIEGEGTPERAWQAWDGLARLAPLALDELVPPASRAVVVAPHPDDEVVGCGGTLASLSRAGRELLVVGLTDGEASYPGSLRWTPTLLAARRRDERLAGLRCLGVAGAPFTLGIADGGVAAVEDQLAASLDEFLRPGDVVLTTWRHDGHPDHEAAGRACVRAARRRGCGCWEMPIWTWHWASLDDCRVPWARVRRLGLDEDAVDRKRRAIAAHGSQLEGVVQEGMAAVLPGWALARMMRAFECFIDGGVDE